MTDWNKAHLKVIIIGNSGVGKSSFMNRYVNQRFTNMYRATIGTDFLTKEVNIGGSTAVLQIWDTAGTERFQSLGTPLYRGSHCCMLVFDVTSRASFSALEVWRKEFLVQGEPPDPANFPFIVFGNKTDLNNREVSRKQALQWCEEIGAQYCEGSAKEDTDVEKPFFKAASTALHQKIFFSNNVHFLVGCDVLYGLGYGMPSCVCHRRQSLPVPPYHQAPEAIKDVTSNQEVNIVA